jgi:hypothetical protein
MERFHMEEIDIEIVPVGHGWLLRENGRDGTVTYATREAAFEAIIGSVSNALKEGLEVNIRIAAAPGRTLE